MVRLTVLQVLSQDEENGAMVGDESSGLRLDEAVKRYSDPRLWAEYQAMEGGDVLFRVPLAIIGGYDPNAAFNKLVEQIEAAFLAKLRSGELIATGYHTHDLRKRFRIPSHLWDFLDPDYGESTASGKGVTLVGIRVHQDEPDDKPDDELDEQSMYKTGVQGRPGSSHLLKAELRRRAAAGQLEPTLKAQSDELVKWLNRKHRKAAPIKPRSAANALRDLYRQMRRSHKSDTKA